MEKDNVDIVKRILKKENIEFKTLKQSTSGFTNVVFFVDEKYIIKICGKNTKTEKLEKEIKFYKNVNLDCIPKYVSSGNIDGSPYLIIEQLRGQSLYSIWHMLSPDKRKEVVKQICNILNQFHSLPTQFLENENLMISWKDKWIKCIEKNIAIMKEKGFDVEKLERFAKIQLPIIFAEQKMCLVYNDAHFDNFLLCGDTVKLIDFDRVMYGSIDYELLIIKSMLDNPHKFASEIDEPNVNPKHYVGIWEDMNKYCKQMFDFEYLNQRVFIYQFVYNLGNAYEWCHDEWIVDELDKFYRFFGIK